MAFPRIIAVFCTLWPLALFAQSWAPSDPTDTAAPAPPSRYESAFRGYVAYQDLLRETWRAYNDEVGRAGDHAHHHPAASNRPSSTDRRLHHDR